MCMKDLNVYLVEVELDCLLFIQFIQAVHNLKVESP